LLLAPTAPKEFIMQKRLLVPSRVRRVPRQFSWVDQRLVRDRHIARCDPEALALYLFPPPFSQVRVRRAVAARALGVRRESARERCESLHLLRSGNAKTLHNEYPVHSGSRS
jgi:hypothetical protein